jgi:hypothetical protein
MWLETPMKLGESAGQSIKWIYTGIRIIKSSYASLNSLYELALGVNIIINSDGYRRIQSNKVELITYEEAPPSRHQ